MFHNAHEFAALYPDARRRGRAGAILRAAPLRRLCRSRAARRRIALRAGLRAGVAGAGELRGFVDHAGSKRIQGWAQNVDHPEAPVCLDIYAGGRLIGQALANRYREDLKRAGLGSGCHSFEFIPPAGSCFAPDAVEVRRSLDGVALTHTARRAPRPDASLASEIMRIGTGWPCVSGPKDGQGLSRAVRPTSQATPTRITTPSRNR